MYQQRSMELRSPYPLGPPLPQPPAAGATVHQRAESRLLPAEISHGREARRSGGDGSLQQWISGQGLRVVAGEVILWTSHIGKLVCERVQKAGMGGGHTEQRARGHRARTLLLQEYFFAAAAHWRPGRALHKVEVALLGAAAAPGAEVLRWKRIFGRGEGARAVCGRHVELGICAACCEVSSR